MKRIAIALVAGSLAAVSAWAHHAGERFTAGDITVSHVWSYEIAASAHSGRVYMTVENTGGEADRLVGARTSAAGSVTIQGQAIDGEGVLAVRNLSGVAIEPGQSVAFQPGSLWLELEGMRRSYAGGQHFHLTLNFERAGEIEVDVDVEAVDHQHDHEGGHRHGS